MQNMLHHTHLSQYDYGKNVNNMDRLHRWNIMELMHN